MIAFSFRAMCMVKSLKKIKKSLKLYEFRKAQELCSNAGLIKRDKQSSELTVERGGSFIGSLMAEIRDAYLELNLSETRVQCSACVKRCPRLETSNAIFAFQVQLRAMSQQ